MDLNTNLAMRKRGRRFPHQRVFKNLIWSSALSLVRAATAELKTEIFSIKRGTYGFMMWGNGGSR
jgi:hypothetical protein